MRYVRSPSHRLPLLALFPLLLAAAACGSSMPAAVEPAPAGADPVAGVPHDLARVRVDSAGEVVELILGPVALAPGAMLRAPVQLVSLPVTGWLRGYEWEMVDAEGDRLPDDLLHHVNLIDPDRRELFAPIARRVIAAGRETRKQKLPPLIGYPVAEGTRLLVAAMFDNPTGTSYPAAYLRIRMPYTTGGLFRPRSVYPFYMDVMGLVGEKSFPVPPGRTARSWFGQPATDVRILGVGGHLHDHARTLVLTDATTGKAIWRAEPKIDAEGRLLEVPTKYVWWRGGIALRRAHWYRVSAEYLNPGDQPASHGGMGVVAGIALGSDRDWPPLDRSDPSYLQDLHNVLSAPKEAGDHGHHGH